MSVYLVSFYFSHSYYFVRTESDKTPKTTRSALQGLGTSVHASAGLLADAIRESVNPAPPVPSTARPNKPAAYKLRLMTLIKNEEKAEHKSVLRKALYCKDPDLIECIVCYLDLEENEAMSYDSLLEELHEMMKISAQQM